MKTLISGMPLLAGALLTGCAAPEFYAVSDSAGKDGGITLVKSRVSPGKNLFTPLRTVNYLIRDPASGFFYGTVSRISPAEAGGVAASAVKFLGVFAPTQLPLAVIEGILTVVIVIGLETYAKPELRAIGFSGSRKEA